MKAIEERIKFIYDGARVKRFHCHSLLKEQTVGAHSFGVAALIAIMYEDKPPPVLSRLLQAALFHDLAEQIVGDVQSPAKKSSDVLKKLLDEVEDRALVHVGMYVVLTTEEKRMLKMADNLDGFAKCVEEKILGNDSLEEVRSNYFNYILSLKPVGREEEVLNAIMRRIYVS